MIQPKVFGTERIQSDTGKLLELKTQIFRLGHRTPIITTCETVVLTVDLKREGTGYVLHITKTAYYYTFVF